jgi:hypothetical protein
MSSHVQSPTYAPSPFVLLIVVCLAVCPWSAMADELSTSPTTMNVRADGAIRMNLNAGTVQIVGVADDKLTVSWHSTSTDDERDVSVKLKRSEDGKDATVILNGPGSRMHYRIEVPKQSNVVIHMRAGNLDVRGILGSVDADLLAGNMDLRVADPRHYHTVTASVTAGGLTARPWRADTGGLWRSFTASGDGDYELRARLLAGQLTIRSD